MLSYRVITREVKESALNVDLTSCKFEKTFESD